MFVFATTWLRYPGQAGIIALLILANAFFVATEFAFVKIRSSQLKTMRVPGRKNWPLGLAIRVSNHLDRYLSPTQSGITLTSLGLGWVGEPVVEKWIERPLGHIGVSDHYWVVTISFTIAFAVITFLHIVLGELVPKYFAIQRPRAVVLWVAAPLFIFYHVGYPFIWVLN